MTSHSHIRRKFNRVTVRYDAENKNQRKGARDHTNLQQSKHVSLMAGYQQTVAWHSAFQLSAINENIINPRDIRAIKLFTRSQLLNKINYYLFLTLRFLKYISNVLGLHKHKLFLSVFVCFTPVLHKNMRICHLGIQ